MPTPQRKAQKKTRLSKAQSNEPSTELGAAPIPQRDFLAQTPAKPGGNVQAHATSLTRAAGNRLARAGNSILQLQRQYGNRYVQRVVNFARKITPPLQAQADPENKTGLPDELKTNVENLSGLSLDDVKVHYNSEKPAQVEALAYTQGADIHVAPGQEAHLPHETWHVVQQKQGRVQPTLQAKDLSINDDPGLENEATVMGAKAMQPSQPMSAVSVQERAPAQLKRSNPVQFLLKYPWDQEHGRLEGPPEKIEFNRNMSYETLIDYKTKWNEKQVDRNAHPQWVFEAGDLNTLNQLLEAKEGDLGQVQEVICPEGEAKVALPGQSLTFGSVTSCMTISVVLNDDSLISAHNGLFARLPNGGINRINQIKNARFPNSQIVSVLAIGAGDFWRTNITPDDGSGLNVVTRNRNAFRRYLSGQFGNVPASFQEHNDGKATISDQRQYVPPP
jgi:hypothetical protein